MEIKISEREGGGTVGVEGGVLRGSRVHGHVYPRETGLQT